MATPKIARDSPRESWCFEDLADPDKCELDSYLISLIIPIYNGFEKLITAVDTTLRALDEIELPSELILAEDGSDDGSCELATELAAKNPKVRLLHSDERLGRGRALKKAIIASHGDVISYIDVDLATDMAYLPLLIRAVLDEGFDFATGSRMMPSSNAHRSRTRYIASKTYNLMIRFLLRSKIVDHQCGFKAFRRDSVIPILDQVRDNHWFWDTELLVRGQRRGYRIKEIPVKWSEANGTKVRLFRDSYRMGSSILKLWWDLHKSDGHH